MNNFRKKMVYLQCCSKQAADMLRKQPCLVRTENLDNSLYTRTKTEVVHPIVYYCNHSALVGWVSTYTHWCELIFILCVQVVQNLQNRMKLVRTFFVPKNETAQWKFSGDKHKSLQVYTERTFHQRYPLVML